MSATHLYKQSFNIPAPTLTEKNLPNQAGRVFIVTGGYAGVGEELSKILYGADATIFVAGRSQDKADKSIATIKKAHPDSKGKIEFLQLDLNDLSTIKGSVATFLERTDRLDVLINNAGVMFPPFGTKNEQGHDMQFSTNCLGPFLFTKLLLPTLEKTAASAPKDSVRVLWAGSSAIHILSPKPGGVVFENGSPKVYKNQQTNYGATKTGNLFLAHIMQGKVADKGIISTSFNPGNLKTELQRHTPSVLKMVIGAFLLHPAVYGAYTELWAACSDELTVEKAVKYVAPWGISADEMIRKDIAEELDDGVAQKFWDWCETETSAYA